MHPNERKLARSPDRREDGDLKELVSKRIEHRLDPTERQRGPGRCGDKRGEGERECQRSAEWL